LPDRVSPDPETFHVELFCSLDALDRFEDAWNALLQLDPHANGYLSPGFLKPNLKRIEHGSWAIAFLFRKSSTGDSDLVAVAPFRKKAPTLKRPFPHLVPLVNRYLWDPSPLLHPDIPDEALKALLHELVHVGGRWRTVEMLITSDREQLASSDRILVENAPGMAALFKPARRGDYERRRRSSDLKSERRRLTQLRRQGDVKIEVLSGDLGESLEAFIQLEAQGWKGRAHTALASRDSDMLFIREVVEHFKGTERVQMVSLRLDDELIGGSLMFCTGHRLQAFKLVYSEPFRRFSPGLLTAVATVNCFFESDSFSLATAGGSVDSWHSRFFVDVYPRTTILAIQDRLVPRIFIRGLAWFRAQRKRRSTNESD